MKLQRIIDQLKSLNGATVSVFGQPHTIEHDSYLIDACEVLKSLKEYEVNDIIARCILNAGHSDEGLEYEHGDNSYNYGGYLSNHLQWYYIIIDGKKYIIIAAHLYGDVRGNYTGYAVLQFDDYEQFIYTLFEVACKTLTITVNGEEYHCSLSGLSDTVECYSATGQHICTAYGDPDEIKDRIKEALE